MKRHSALSLWTALALFAFGASSAEATPVSVGTTKSQPVTAVVLVDESGSLTPAAVRDERAAAAALVSSDLSPRSKFLVAGFGSANRPGDSAVTPYCGFIVASDAQARQRLVECANQVHGRSADEGNDTDHAKAIQFALESLADEGPGAPVVFLLTDGVLDVHRSPSYGRDPARRETEAWRRIHERLLPQARAAGTQIWPLGFGAEVSRAKLQAFAAGGANENARCASARSARPHAIVVDDSGAAIPGLLQALVGARCGAVSGAGSTTLKHGATRSLYVRIPPIATAGAITVVKDDPTFKVDFFTPSGDAASAKGTTGGQRFERSARGGRTEALRIANPVPGRWKVVVSDPRGRASDSPVSAFAVWEGALQASIFVSPVAPVPGQRLAVEVRVLSRKGVIVGRDLDGIGAQVQAQGDFGRIPVPVRLRDAAFRGSFPLPDDAKGAVQVIAQVSGRGVSSDRRIEPLTIQAPGMPSASFAFDVPADVAPGATIHGSVVTSNRGSPQPGRLQLGQSSPGALVTLDSTLRRIPTGQARSEFTLHVADDTKLGALYGSVYLVNGEGQRLAGSPFDATVEPPPSWLSRHWKALLLGLLFVIAVLVGAWLTARTRGQRTARQTDTRGLIATLYRDEAEVGRLEQERQPDDPSRFALVVFEPDGDAPPQLLDEQTAAGRGRPIVVTRRESQLSFAVDGKRAQAGAFGSPFELGESLNLIVHDHVEPPPPSIPDDEGHPNQPIVEVKSSGAWETW